jgi:hypothetical protein
MFVLLNLFFVFFQCGSLFVFSAFIRHCVVSCGSMFVLFGLFSFCHYVVFCVYEKKVYTVMVNNPTYINNQLLLQGTTQNVSIHMALKIQVIALDRHSSVARLDVDWASNANTDINKPYNMHRFATTHKVHIQSKQ